MYINDIINTKVHEIDENNGLFIQLKLYSNDGSTVYCPGPLGLALIHGRSYTLISTHIDALNRKPKGNEVLLV